MQRPPTDKYVSPKPAWPDLNLPVRQRTQTDADRISWSPTDMENTA